MGRKCWPYGGVKLLGSGIVGIAVAFAPQMGLAQPAAFDLDGLAAKGDVLARQDPMAAEMRSLQPDASARRGKCLAALGLQLFPAR